MSLYDVKHCSKFCYKSSNFPFLWLISSWQESASLWKAREMLRAPYCSLMKFSMFLWIWNYIHILNAFVFGLFAKSIHINTFRLNSAHSEFDAFRLCRLCLAKEAENLRISGFCVIFCLKCSRMKTFLDFSLKSNFYFHHDFHWLKFLKGWSWRIQNEKNFFSVCIMTACPPDRKQTEKFL